MEPTVMAILSADRHDELLRAAAHRRRAASGRRRSTPRATLTSLVNPFAALVDAAHVRLTRGAPTAPHGAVACCA